MKLILNPFVQNRKRSNTPLPKNASNNDFWIKKSTIYFAWALPKKTLMRINLLTLLLGLGLSQVDANTFAQQITLKRQKTSLENILKALEKQSGYSFFYKKEDLQNIYKTNIDIKNKSLNTALQDVFRNEPFSFEYFDKTIVIKKTSFNLRKTLSEENTSITQAIQQRYITGKVLDENRKPIRGASIRIKSDRSKGVTSQEDGGFSLPISSLNEILEISFLGYATKEIKASLKQNQMTVLLEKQDNSINEVVVTGMMNFKKEAFSGASSTFKQEELKQVANTNVIQALKSLDPSFLVMENNLAGANPNVLPSIELRGQTSISSENLRDEFTNDPNQPLFVLDGFETSLRTIVDLDMNRILSVTILKDASSTAIYGSRASNGVVVIETIKPKPGEIRLIYTSDLNLEIADLSSYNMMNAAEKLEFERLSGVYTARNSDQESQYKYYTPLYNKRLYDVLSGVDTYWLKKPISTGFSHRHSLYAEGGSENFVFNVGGNYKKNKGVMKGSGREDWGGRINLTYRNGKINVNNNLTIQGYGSEESNFGNFSTWVNLNPYYSDVDVNNPVLDSYRDTYYGKNYYVKNPLYDSNLNSFDRSKNWGITNNFQLIYTFNSKWKAQTSLQVNRNTTTQSAFVSPLHSSFLETTALLKGKYTSYEKNYFSYTANAMLSYSQSFGKHTVNANGRIEVEERNNKGLGFTAIGFPLTSDGNPAFAYGYDVTGAPRSASAVTRRNSLIGTANYSYDNRYNADLSFNYDGSTAFGSQNMYSPFFSVGASWNVHKEQFLKEQTSINKLRLRANYGVTGNQNFSSATSISTYQYLSAYNYFGQGVQLATFGNDNLRWQKTQQLSAGIDGTFLNNRLTLDLNAYHKKTVNLAVPVTLPASTGLVGYPFNAGDLTVKGVELTAKYNIIHRPERKTIWSVGITGAKSNQTYNNFNAILEGLNQSLQKSSSLTRYRDGYSPNSIWAVQSAGIDPATGSEIYIKKDGTQTFDYNSKDIVAVGNSNPAIQGVLSTNVSYKGFTLSAYMRYIWHQDALNTAVFNKVENINLTSVINKNQDKRALYERWRNPGDISEFKSIGLTTTSYLTSRFIQRENTLSFESISIGYDFRDAVWLKQSGFSNLRITGLTNEVFRWSTVKRERGIDYPYAKSYSLSISANF